jgi:hypothetical protein
MVLALAALSSAAPAPAAALTVPNPTITFVTVLKQPGGGEIRRATTTLIDVPTPLRVDAGASPDLVATVVVLSLSRLSLVINRLPGSTAPLPASVEAVAHDPTGDLGRNRIAVGYDARASGAPRQFNTTVQLGVGGDANHFAVVQDTSDAPSGLATIAELFDLGSGGTRLRSERIAVAFAPVAPHVRVDATLASPRIQAGVTTSEPTIATIDGALDDGDEVQSLHAVVDQLPEQVALTYVEDNAGLPTVTYDANRPIKSIRARYEQRAGGKLRAAVIAGIDDLPRSLRFALTDATSGTFTASDKIGQVEFAAADGEPRPVEGIAPGALIERKDGVTSFAARLRGLRSASVRAADKLSLDAAIDAQPFAIKIALPGLSLSGTVVDLPPQLSLTVDLASGHVVYDGHGAIIRRIALQADGKLVPGVKHIEATIEGLSSGTAAFVIGHGKATRVKWVGKRALGAIDVVARRGKKAPPPTPPDRDTLYYRDVRGGFVAHVRITGLRKVRVVLPSDKKTPIDVTVRRQSGRPIYIDVRARLGERRSLLVAKGRLLKLPERMHLRIGASATTHIAYDASQARGEIHLSARGTLLPDALRSVRLDVEGLPRVLTVDASRGSKVIKATATPAVGVLSAAIAAHGRARPVAGSGSGVRVTGSSGYALRLRGLKSFVVRTDGPLRLDARLARQRFAVSADLPRDGLRITGTIASLPRHLGLTLDIPHGVVAYDGHGETIERIAVAATSRRPLLDRARRVGLTVLDFPSARLHFDAGNGNVAFNAEKALGTVDLTATDGTAVLPRHAEDRDLVYYHDVPGAFALHARVTGVRRATFAADPLNVELRRQSRRSVDVDVRAGDATGPLVVTGNLEGLPGDVNVKLGPNGGGTLVQYDASHRLGALHLSAGGGSLGFRARVDVSDLPRHLVADLHADSTFAVRADTPIGSLAVAYAKTAAPEPLAGSGSGVRVILDGPREGIAARLRGIKSGALLQQSPLKFEGEIARQPLAINVDGPVQGLHIKGTIADLPRHVGLTYAPEAGLIEFDGGGERVGRVDFDVRSRKTVLLGRHHVFGTVLGLPSARVLLTGDSSGAPGLTLTAGDQVDLVDFTVADGTAAAPLAGAGHDLVQYHDVKGDRVLRVRVSGVRGFRLALPEDGRPITARLVRRSALPVDVDVKAVLDKTKPRSPLELTGSLTGVPAELNFKLLTEGGVRASYDGSGPLGSLRVVAKGAPLPATLEEAVLDVRGAPARLAVGIPDGCQPRITYRGSGPVQRISLNARGGDEPLFEGATRVRATVEGVPDALTLTPGERRIDFSASRPIGRLTLVATNAKTDPPAFAGGEDGLYYRDVPARYAVRAQVTGLRRVVYATKPVEVVVARPGGRRLRVDLLTRPVSRAPKPAPKEGPACAKPAAKRKEPAKGAKVLASLRLTGYLDGLPDSLHLIYKKKGPNATYRATGPLRRLSLLAGGLDLGGIRGHVQLDVERVPSQMTLSVADAPCTRTSDVTCKIIRAYGSSPIGRLEARASSGKFAVLSGPLNKLVASVTDKGGLNLGARINNLRSLRMVVGRTPTEIKLRTVGSSRQPALRTYVRLGRLKDETADAWTGALGLTLKDLPEYVSMCFDRGPACVEKGPDKETATASALFLATPKPGTPQMTITGIVCMKQVQEGNCVGKHSARIVFAVQLEKLLFKLRPLERGFVYAGTGGTKISGEFSYFSSDRQKVCFRLENDPLHVEDQKDVADQDRVVTLEGDTPRFQCLKKPNKKRLELVSSPDGG